MSRGEGSRSLRRRAATREVQATLLIVCEGEKTEPQYFRSLCRASRLTAVRIVGKECGNAPISVVEYAVARKKERKKNAQRGLEESYDSVWCVMDVEGKEGHESLHRALDKAQLALDRAARMLSNHPDARVVRNPSTEIFRLVRKLRVLASSARP